MDRRGFGASGDGEEYSIEQEFAGIVDAVAERTGEPVVLWGHSYGASCVMGAAALTGNVGHLVVYEPSLGMGYPPGWVEAVEEAVARGDNEGALLLLFRDVLELSPEQIEVLRATPPSGRCVWPPRRPCPASPVSSRSGCTGRGDSTGSRRRRCS